MKIVVITLIDHLICETKRNKTWLLYGDYPRNSSENGLDSDIPLDIDALDSYYGILRGLSMCFIQPYLCRPIGYIHFSGRCFLLLSLGHEHRLNSWAFRMSWFFFLWPNPGKTRCFLDLNPVAGPAGPSMRFIVLYLLTSLCFPWNLPILGAWVNPNSVMWIFLYGIKKTSTNHQDFPVQWLYQTIPPMLITTLVCDG